MGMNSRLGILKKLHAWDVRAKQFNLFDPIFIASVGARKKAEVEVTCLRRLQEDAAQREMGNKMLQAKIKFPALH